MSPRKKVKRKTADTPQDLVPVEDKVGPKAEFVSEDYNKVARAAKLDRIMLTLSNFELQPTYFDDDTESVSTTFNYDAAFLNPVYLPKLGRASCFWKWSLAAIREDKSVVEIEATYLVFYSGLEDCSEAAVKRYMARVSRFAVYPYFRAHVSQLSWESSANLPLLPTIAS